MLLNFEIFYFLYHKRYYFHRIKTKLLEVEKKGVKTLIWNVTPTYKKLFDKDEWMTKRLIHLEYKGESVDNIESLMNKHDELVLSKDTYFRKFQKRNPPEDGHPSLMAQKMISNSVIKALNLRKKKYLKNIRKENMFKLLKKIKNKKKIFRN